MRFAVPFVIGWATMAFVALLFGPAFTADSPVFEVTTSKFDGDVDEMCAGRVIATLVSVAGPFCFRYAECPEILTPDYMLCALRADLDGDGDVDLADFVMFQRAMFGSDR